MTPDAPQEEAKALVERLTSSAEAFRRYPIFTADGDPVLLTVQADELAEAAAEITRLTDERDALRAANERMGRLGRAIERERDDALSELSATSVEVLNKVQAERDEALAKIQALTCGLPELLASGDLLDEEGLIAEAEELHARLSRHDGQARE